MARSTKQTSHHHVIDDVMKQLYARRENLVLLLIDAASYMTAAGNVLRELYPHLSRVTCIEHLIYNCAERVRNYFPAVDNLIAVIQLATVINKDRRAICRSRINTCARNYTLGEPA